MAKITQIEVNRRYLFKIGQFENATFGASATAVLDDGDDPDEEYHKLVEFVDERVQNDIEAFNDGSES